MEKAENEDVDILYSSTIILDIFDVFIPETFHLVNFNSLNEEQSNIQFYLEIVCMDVMSIIEGLKECITDDGWLQMCVENIPKNSIYSNKLVTTWIEKYKCVLPVVDFYIGAIEDANIVILEFLRKRYEPKLKTFEYICSPYKLGLFSFTDFTIQCYLCRDKVFYFFPFKERKYCINCLANGYSSCGGSLADWVDVYCELILMENTPQYVFHKCLGHAENREFTNVCNQCQCESYSYIENFGKLPISPKLFDHFGCTCSES